MFRDTASYIGSICFFSFQLNWIYQTFVAFLLCAKPRGYKNERCMVCAPKRSWSCRFGVYHSSLLVLQRILLSHPHFLFCCCCWGVRERGAVSFVYTTCGWVFFHPQCLNSPSPVPPTAVAFLILGPYPLWEDGLMHLGLKKRPVVIIRELEPKAWWTMDLSGGKIGCVFLSSGKKSGCDFNSPEVFVGKEENMQKTPVFSFLIPLRRVPKSSQTICWPG